MRALLQNIIEEFAERALPILQHRLVSIKEMEGKVRTIIGMRRVGKTSLCFQKINELILQGLPRNQILYINFEDERLLPFTSAEFSILLDRWFHLYPENKKLQCHLFLDEIQNIPHWDKFVRRVIDSENIEVYVTGSSSKMLSSEIATALRGRSLTTEVFPYSFKEFLKTRDLCPTDPKIIGSAQKAQMSHFFEIYLEIGGFPEIQNVSKELRRDVLRGYVDTVVLRDVIERHSVSNISCLRALLRQIFHSPAQLFSVSKCYNDLKSQGIACTKASLFEYIHHLADAFLLYQVPILSHSERVRQVNPKKMYLIDTGLIGAMSHRLSADRGAILENIVYMELRRQQLCIEYAHTSQGNEIDFVIRSYPDSPLSDATLIQVTWDMGHPATRERELRALREGMAEFGTSKAIVVTAFEEGYDTDSGIEIVPAWRWLVQFEFGGIEGF
jgi:uncharacterized protein